MDREIIKSLLLSEDTCDRKLGLKLLANTFRSVAIIEKFMVSLYNEIKGDCDGYYMAYCFQVRYLMYVRDLSMTVLDPITEHEIIELLKE